MMTGPILFIPNLDVNLSGYAQHWDR